MHAGQVRTDEAATSSLLAPFARDVLLATGRAVHVRPADPSDIERLRTFYEQLDEHSTYLRFFSLRRSIPDDELERATVHDVRRHVTLVTESDGELIGVGSYHADPDEEEAEVAFTVADDHHHEGIATVLLEDLALIARAAGFRRLGAETLPENAAMLGVFRTVGLVHRLWFEDGVVRVQLDLTSDDRPPGRRRPARLEGRRALAALDRRAVARRRDRRRRRCHGARSARARPPPRHVRRPGQRRPPERRDRRRDRRRPDRGATRRRCRISPSSPCPPPRWPPRSPGVAPPACAALSSCRRGSPRAGPTARACRTTCSPPPAASACDSSDRTASASCRRPAVSTPRSPARRSCPGASPSPRSRAASGSPSPPKPTGATPASPRSCRWATRPT